MTEQEILQRQEINGNQEFYLMLVGKFLHAYGHGAFALSRATGYRVLRKQRRGEEVVTCGFPMERLDLVRQRLRDAGGTLGEVDGKTFLFCGIDGTPDLAMVKEPESEGQVRDAGRRPDHATSPSDSWLVEAVRAFNLSMSTPMDAMLFIGTLQQRLRESEHKDDACESPSGHGLTE